MLGELVPAGFLVAITEESLRGSLWQCPAPAGDADWAPCGVVATVIVLLRDARGNWQLNFSEIKVASGQRTGVGSVVEKRTRNHIWHLLNREEETPQVDDIHVNHIWAARCYLQVSSGMLKATPGKKKLYRPLSFSMYPSQKKKKGHKDEITKRWREV